MPDVTPHDPLPPRRSPFEWSLSALRPADADVARPSFMYTAGQASRDKVVRLWRWVAGGSVALAVGVAALAVGVIADERGRKTEVRTPTVVPPPTHLPIPEPDPPAPYYRPPAVEPPAVVARPADPTPHEIAAALDRRRNILVGGLGLIPDVKPSAVPSSDPTFTYSSGVFGAPTSPKPADPR